MKAKSDDSNIKESQNSNEAGLSEAAALSRIKDLVQRHKVCWEAHPEQVLVSSQVRGIGFVLELYGTHEVGTDHVSPGCEHCVNVKSALKEIAYWILPREERPSMYQVEIEGQSLSYSSERGDRADVRATIRILHRHRWDHPIDDCEVRCLKEMERSLSELGACKGAWRDSLDKP
jgi:hypothetical protein